MASYGIAQLESGGAALDQVFGMTAAAAAVSLFLLYLAFMHRTRRITWLGRLADHTGSKLKLPGWAALPLVMFVSTILTAFFGFIWDVSLHIGRGRDEGPLANPAHYFILVGLFFLFIAGALAIILPLDEAPTGGLLIASTGLYALIGFPLDDIWHPIFGQDMTLWGRTHLMLIGVRGCPSSGFCCSSTKADWRWPQRRKRRPRMWTTPRRAAAPYVADSRLVGPGGRTSEQVEA